MCNLGWFLFIYFLNQNVDVDFIVLYIFFLCVKILLEKLKIKKSIKEFKQEIN